MANSIVDHTADRKQAPIRRTAVVQQMNWFKSASLVETGPGACGDPAPWGDPAVAVGGEAGVEAVSAGSTVPCSFWPFAQCPAMEHAT